MLEILMRIIEIWKKMDLGRGVNYKKILQSILYRKYSV